MKNVLAVLITFSLLMYTLPFIEFYHNNRDHYNAFVSLILLISYTYVALIVLEFLFGHAYAVIHLRKFLYPWITNKRLQRYLDSIFFIKYYLVNFDSGTYQNERWKNYIFAFHTFPITLIILLLPSGSALFANIFLRILKLYNYITGKTVFDFENSARRILTKIGKKTDTYILRALFEILPFSFQDRFIELQSPLTKKRLKQIYPWIKNDKHVIDKLHIDTKWQCVDQYLIKYNAFSVLEEVEWENFSVSWNVAQSYFENKTLLVVRFDEGRKKNWNLESVKKLKIVKTAIFYGLEPFEFQYLYNNLNLSMITELEIKYSNLTLKEFALIKNLNLKSIYYFTQLENGYSIPEMHEFILETFAKIPNIRVFFDFFYDGNFFENLIVDWIIKYGYRESFIFTFRLHKYPWALTFASDPLIISGFDCYQLKF